MKARRVLAMLLLMGLAAVPSARATEKSVRSPQPLSPPPIEYQQTIDTSTLETLSKRRSVWKKLFQWLTGLTETQNLQRPYAVVEDSRGRLLVADPDGRVVHILDFEHRRYEVLAGTEDEPFLSPIGVAVDGRDDIYVSDSARSQVYVFDRTGKFRRRIGDGKGSDRLKRPTGIAFDSNTSQLIVADTARHQILLFTPQGDIVKAIGRRGNGPAEFNFPIAVAAGPDGIYVVDAMNFRIQVLTPEGDFLRAFGGIGNTPGDLYRPKGIALDSRGNIYVVEGLFETVQIFSPRGELLQYFGSSGPGDGQFSLPAGIYIAPRDRIYVADSLNRRVQVFRQRRDRK